MQLSPFVNSGPPVLPLDTLFEIPDWWRPTGTRWNSEKRKGNRDQDGQREHRYLKKFALEGAVASYRFGTYVKSYPLNLNSQAGLMCSAESCLLVVECDDPDDWDQTILGDAIPTVRSRRGHHFYFAVDPDLADELPTDGPIPGGDVQTKGFVPAPGTRHPSGVTYELVADRINVADLALLRRLRVARETQRVAQLAYYREQGGRGDWSGNGGVNGQDDYLAMLVAWPAVRDGRTESETWVIWQAEAAALPLKDRDDPFTREDFLRHYQGAVHEKTDRDAGQSEAAEAEDWIVDWAESLRGSGGDGGDDDGPDDLGGFQPPGYVVPSPYVMNTEGVWEIVIKNKQPEPEQVMHRPVIVSGICRDEEGEISYELTWRDYTGDDCSVAAPARDVADRTRLMGVLPGIVTSKGATGAAEFLTVCRSANSEWLSDRVKRTARALGWYGTGQDEFVSGSGRPYEIRDTSNLGEWLTGHRQAGSLDAWTESLERAPWRVLVLTAAALSAPLLRLLDVHGFVVDNSGGTTQGKTRGARVAASVWGCPDSVILSWSATRAALELYARNVRGLPLVIDESKLARDGDQISGLVYQVTSGMSTGRLERSADRLRGSEHIESVIITNGEQPLLSASGKRDGGAAARVIEMWGAPYTNAEDADAINAVVTENYGHAGELFANALIGLGAGELRSRYHALREQARAMAESDVARRRGDAVAVVMLAAQIAVDLGLLPAISKSAWTELLGGDAGREGSDDLATAALEMLWSELAFNPGIFWQKDNPNVIAGFDRPTGGWQARYEPTESWLALKPEWLDKFLADRGFDGEGIRRQWADRDWTAKDPKGKRTVLIRISDKPARCVKVTFKPESISPEPNTGYANGYSDD